MPAERPELLCLVAIDSPEKVNWASLVAAPVFKRIVQRILSLRQAPLRHSAPLLEEQPPPPPRADIHLVGLSRKAATDALKRLGMTYQIAGEGDRVVGQHIDIEENNVSLFLAAAPITPPDHHTEAKGSDSLYMPDVRGAPVRQAVAQLTQLGFQIKISGSGRVIAQSPETGCGRKTGNSMHGRMQTRKLRYASARIAIRRARYREDARKIIPILGVLQPIRDASKKVMYLSHSVAMAAFQIDIHLFFRRFRQVLEPLLPKRDVDVKNTAFVQTANTHRALAHIAHRFYNKPSKQLKMIGVTGTNGKTSTVYLIRAVLDAAGFAPGLIGNY